MPTRTDDGVAANLKALENARIQLENFNTPNQLQKLFDDSENIDYDNNGEWISSKALIEDKSKIMNHTYQTLKDASVKKLKN